MYRKKRIFSNSDRPCHQAPRSVEFLAIRSSLAVSKGSCRLTLTAPSNQSDFGDDLLQYVRRTKFLALRMMQPFDQQKRTRASNTISASQTTPPPHEATRVESFNDWGGGDTTISSPGWSPKQPLPRIGLHDLLYGWQACLEFNSFQQGVGQICPREGLFSCRPLEKRGQICDIPDPPNR